MRILYSFPLILTFCTVKVNSQTIHMANYNDPYKVFCPNALTDITLYARDVFNNKIHGEFAVAFYINDIQVYNLGLRDDVGNVSTLYFDIGTQSNKEAYFEVVHPGDTL